MNKRLQCWLAAILLGFMTVSVAVPRVGHAQLFDEESDSEFGGDSDDEFIESAGDEPGSVPSSISSGEADLTEGDTYTDESSQPAAAGTSPAAAVARRQLQLRQGADRDMLPMNAAWGAGTGLLIGGWLALIGEGSNRDTLRSIGMGVVLGSIVGVIVGLKSVITFTPAPTTLPAPPPSSMNTRPEGHASSWTPVVSFGSGPTQFGFRFTF